MNYELTSAYKPTGDQPEAIAQLTEGVLQGVPAQTLLGVTGSGKTFTIANVIANINKPTLILSHNKTLAAQLYSEFKGFFPNNAVEYYVSYYDYYQPEAYLPSSDTYIEKDLAINDEIDKLRLAATSALLSGRKAVISVVGEKPTLFRPGHITLEDLERALGEEVEVSKAILEKLPEGAVVRSPGMKYKHYAPKADVTLLDGTFEQFKAYVDAHADQNPSCLCFTGEAEKLGWPCVEYGREGDGADQAKHIFRSLRALDEQGDGVVYARCPKKDGLSMAVYNRLIRAAAFRVIQL